MLRVTIFSAPGTLRYLADFEIDAILKEISEKVATWAKHPIAHVEAAWIEPLYAQNVSTLHVDIEFTASVRQGKFNPTKKEKDELVTDIVAYLCSLHLGIDTEVISAWVKPQFEAIFDQTVKTEKKKVG